MCHICSVSPGKPISAIRVNGSSRAETYGGILCIILAYYHEECLHQGKGNVILFPTDCSEQGREGRVRCRERLGGLLKYYDREAA
jgi:hypothetical protein